MEWLKEYTKNVSLSNNYTSMYTVSQFQNILKDTTGTGKNISGDYNSQYQIRQISIVERWGPFLGIDITFANNISTSFKYNKDRTLNFNLTNGQLSEQRGNELSIGAGWRKNGLILPFKGAGGRRFILENDINFRLDFSIKKAVTKIMYLDRETQDPVQGQTIYALRPSIDYNITQQLTFRLFYDYRKTIPETSNSYPTIIQSGGFSLRYTIQ
jgi:cell surface protein SprA